MSALLRLRVVEVVAETHDARSVVLEDEAGLPVPYRAGQFLTFRVPGPEPVARCYSLSSSPAADPTRLAVTVKKVEGGRGSSWMCDEVRVGDVVEALPPAGLFTPRDLDADVLLVAAGSGVTPVMSILRTVLSEGRGHVVLLYANRDDRAVIFARQLRDLEEAHPDRLVVHHWLESLQGLPARTTLSARLAPYADREAFLCGPEPFMAAARHALLHAGAPAGRIHVEEFRSLSGDPFSAPEPMGAADDSDAALVRVDLDGARHDLRWPRGRKLLDVLLGAGLPAPYSCREGACSACACVVLDGEVKMERNDVLDTADLADGIVLACQALPVSDAVVVSYDA